MVAITSQEGGGGWSRPPRGTACVCTYGETISWSSGSLARGLCGLLGFPRVGWRCGAPGFDFWGVLEVSDFGWLVVQLSGAGEKCGRGLLQCVTVCA